MTRSPRVALFVTCLVDLHRPSVGFASISLLEAAGCSVEVPRTQTCCGQPAYNGGDRQTARELGLGLITTFSAYDYVVAPSGSCAGMISRHLPHLFDDDPNLRAKADALAAKTFELTAFLVDVMNFVPTPPPLSAVATYHDFMRRPARTRRQNPTEKTACRRSRINPGRDARTGNLLRFWRHILC